jgi:hypothetical protein
MIVDLLIYGVINDSTSSTLLNDRSILVGSDQIKKYVNNQVVKVPENAVGLRVLLKLYSSGCDNLPNDTPIKPTNFYVTFTNPINKN